MSLGKRFPTFRRNVLPSSRIKGSQKTLFNRQRQGTMIVRNAGKHSPKNATFVCPKCVAFLDCAAVILLRSTVLQEVVEWFVDWLVGCVVGWLVG